MSREENLDFIPNDLIIEINSRLPAKSVARFRCVSKLWESMLSGPCFNDLFLKRSWTRPLNLFGLQGDDEWSFYSSPQSQNPYDKSCGLASFHMRFSRDMKPHFGGVTSGLIYFSSMKISENSEETSPVICNLCTGKFAILPKQPRYDRNSSSFLGFDPIDKQFKILFIAYPFCDENDHLEILTVEETGKMCWRKIKCGVTHNPSFCEGICINGVLYYFAPRIDKTDFYEEKVYKKSSYMIVCFDVRSEEFKFIDIESYKDDVEKHEWSKYVYSLEEDAVIAPLYHSIAGVTISGEIVFFTRNSSKSFYVIYFNPERNTLRKVKIQGFENDSSVFTDVNLIEDLYVNDAKQFK